MDALKRVWERIQRLKPLRVWKRYGDARGDLLAAGVGYFAFFSAFPGIVLLFTIAGFVLRSRPELIDEIAAGVNSALPGFVRTADNPQGVIPLSAPGVGALTVAGAVSFVTLLLSGLGWIGSLRAAIRAIFGLGGSPGNVLTDKLRDLGVFIGLGFGIGLSAILSGAIGGLAGPLSTMLGAQHQEALVTILGLVVGAVIDISLMVLLLRVLSGAPLPWRDVRNGAIVGGVGMTLMKFFGSFLIAQATKSPLIASVAVPVGLLFWLNLMSRVTLFAASWAASDAAEAAEAAEATVAAGRAADPAAPHEASSAEPTQDASTVAVPPTAVAEAPARRRGKVAAAVGLGAAVYAGVEAVIRASRSRRR